MMATRSRTRKRKLSYECAEDTSNTHNTRKRKKVDPKQAKVSQLVDLSEYSCCVCTELSNCKIFQCPNGCIICEECYPRINPCQCPLCRSNMSKTTPIRCRIAERTLAPRLVSCKHDGCDAEVMFCKLKSHQANDCPFKTVYCKYSVLGCKWKGLRQHCGDHELECVVDQDKSLKVMECLLGKLHSYKQFSRSSHLLTSESIWVDAKSEFTKYTEDIYSCGYDFQVGVRCVKKKITKNQELFQISAQIKFAEENELSMDNSLEIGVCLVIEPRGKGVCDFSKQWKVAVTTGEYSTAWHQFKKQMTKQEYTALFQGGFDVHVFCVDEYC